MPKKSKEKAPESATEEEIVSPEASVEPQGEAKEVIEEKPEEVAEEIKKLEEEVAKIIDQGDVVETEDDKEQRAQKIKEYQDKYIPDYLRSKKQTLFSKIACYFQSGRGKLEREGQENMPEKGPYLVICNHWGGQDAESLIRTFKKDNLHMAAAKEVWWNRGAFFRWIFKKMGTIPVEESLSNLTEEEKEAALLRQDDYTQKCFRKIIDKEKSGSRSSNIEFVRQSVAVLSRGDAVGIFPEGLWLNPHGSAMNPREKEELKQGYGGMELLARQYQKLTGEELPIVPTAFIKDPETKKRKVIIGKPLLLSENNTELSDTDWCMAHVAKMLPEHQRGYYTDMAEEI